MVPVILKQVNVLVILDILAIIVLLQSNKQHQPLLLLTLIITTIINNNSRLAQVIHRPRLLLIPNKQTATQIINKLTVTQIINKQTQITSKQILTRTQILIAILIQTPTPTLRVIPTQILIVILIPTPILTPQIQKLAQAQVLILKALNHKILQA